MSARPAGASLRPEADVLAHAVVAPRASVLETLAVIDRSGVEVALVCDHARRLLGVVTDGDIRRAILRGDALDAPVERIANKRFVAVGEGASRAEMVRLMVEHGIKCVPVLAADGTLQDLCTLHRALAGQETDAWGVIMAGGKGERLGELTAGLPKPMIPVDNKPILEHVVRLMVSHGVRRIFVSVNYLGGMIEDYFGDGRRFHCRIDYLRETDPLGTAGPLGMLPARPDAPVVVMNGDLLTGINLTRMLGFHAAGGYAATVAVRSHVVQLPFGVIETEGAAVRALREKPRFEYPINTGIYVLDPAVVARVRPGAPLAMTDLLRACLDERLALGAYAMQEGWSDVGLPADLAAAHQARAAG